MSELEDWYYIVRPGTNLRYLQQDKTPLAVHYTEIDNELKRCACMTGGKWKEIEVLEFQRLFGVM